MSKLGNVIVFILITFSLVVRHIVLSSIPRVWIGWLTRMTLRNAELYVHQIDPGANAGAAVGVASGMSAGAGAGARAQIAIVGNCMIGRSYRVLH